MQQNDFFRLTNESKDSLLVVQLIFSQSDLINKCSLLSKAPLHLSLLSVMVSGGAETVSEYLEAKTSK